MRDGDITNGEQINNYLLKKFPTTVYRGIIIDNEIPQLQDNQFVINNQDRHWTAIYKKNGVLQEFDSYGRDMLPTIKDTYIKPENRQGASGSDYQDCGQRTIARMLITFKDFIKK